MPIVEAMGHGVPVVAYGVAAVPETVADAGLVLPDKEPLRFAAAVHRVVVDPALAGPGWPRPPPGPGGRLLGGSVDRALRRPGAPGRRRLTRLRRRPAYAPAGSGARTAPLGPRPPRGPPRAGSASLSPAPASPTAPAGPGRRPPAGTAGRGRSGPGGPHRPPLVAPWLDQDSGPAEHLAERPPGESHDRQARAMASTTGRQNPSCSRSPPRRRPGRRPSARRLVVHPAGKCTASASPSSAA